MKFILVNLFFLLASPVFAEMIGNIEFHLPDQEQRWKVATELGGSEKADSKTVIYIPENMSKQETKEFFGVHLNNYSVNLKDKESLEKALENAQIVKFPNAKATVKILVLGPYAAFYEYTINQDNIEKAQGWMRVFSSPQQTVMLNYQTEQINDIKKIQPIWLKALQQAKPVNK